MLIELGQLWENRNRIKIHRKRRVELKLKDDKWEKYSIEAEQVKSIMLEMNLYISNNPKYKYSSFKGQKLLD